MRVPVALFARYREAVGRGRIEVDVAEGATVEDVWTAVAAAHPALIRYRPHTLFAVGTDYVEGNHPSRRGRSGVLSPRQRRGGLMYRIVEEPLSADAVARAVTVPESGGVAVFLGVVRNQTAGRRVVALEYEAHVPMAEAKLKEIGEAVYGRWPGVRQVVILHRIGRLLVGEASVAIGVSAAHRQDAFEACQYAIDTVKQIVPVWKRELFEDGSAWVGLQGESPPPGWNPGDGR